MLLKHSISAIVKMLKVIKYVVRNIGKAPWPPPRCFYFQNETQKGLKLTECKYKVYIVEDLTQLALLRMNRSGFSEGSVMSCYFL